MPRHPLVDDKIARRRRDAALLVGFTVLTTACGVNPGELGYFGRARFHFELEGRVSTMPVSAGIEVPLHIFDETGDCIEVFPLSRCPEFRAPFTVVPTSDDVVDVTRVRTAEGEFEHRVRTLREGHVELQVRDADGVVVDFLPFEVALPSFLALTDMSYELGRARALPPDIGVPVGVLVPLRLGVAGLDGRMLLRGEPSHLHVDVREAAPGFAVAGDVPRTGSGDAGFVALGPPSSSDVPPMPEESALGVVPVSMGDHLRVEASAAGRVRLEVPSLREAIYPLSARVSSVGVAAGALGLEIIEGDVENGTLTRAHLCASHAIDGVAQTGWPFEWSAPSGFSIVSAGHTSASGSTSRCVVAVWDRSTSFDARSETFSVRFGALSAEVPASLVAALRP